MKDGQVFQEQIGRIEQLVQEIESAGDPALRATAKELVQSVMDLHGAAIERIVEMVKKAGDPASSILRSLGADELVGGLLVLYGQHPEDFATRVHRGIEKARKMLARHGADMQVLTIAEATVRLQIDTHGHSCSSTAAELESIIRGAVFETAPDAAEIIIELPESKSASGFVPLESLQTSNGSTSASVLSRP
jgi:Fe-S cluster biogenesis protein NfuA